MFFILSSAIGSFHKAGCQKNPASYEVWHERLKNGFPPKWENKKEKPKTWSDEEKEKVFDALSILPVRLLENSIEGIYRLAVFNDYKDNPAANHENQIVLYDAAFKDMQNLAQILSHEFAHKSFS